MDSNNAIEVRSITKIYKLYSKPSERLKEAINPLNKKYHKDFYALNNVNFVVKKGETVGIIGKNGSGKSTLLKIIAGVLSATYGSVNIQGRVTSLLELGAGFNPEYTGIENIFLNGTIMGYSENEINKKIDSILDFADIGDFVYKPVKIYSSGMFARLAFALVINFEPDILIVDEALSVGDIFFQQKCNIYMKEKMKNVTKLLVTHDMGSIANMTDRAIVLSNGNKIFDGKPLEAVEFYLKSMHSEVFSKGIENNLLHESSCESDSLKNLTYIEEEKLGGALDAKIVAFDYKVNNTSYNGYIQEGFNIDINFIVKSSKNIKDVIFGYLVNDRFGNQIFGENTLSSGFNNLFILKDSRYSVNFKIKWPEIKEGAYFITLGIGEGSHEMQHVIQCWAHNIIELKCISPNKSIHGIFNNKIEDFSINEIKV